MRLAGVHAPALKSEPAPLLSSQASRAHQYMRLSITSPINGTASVQQLLLMAALNYYSPAHSDTLQIKEYVLKVPRTPPEQLHILSDWPL